MFFDALDKEYQALLDKVLDAPLVGRFQVGKSGKSLIDAGLIEKCLEAMEPFVTQEPNHIDENFRREKRWFYPFEAIRELLINALAHRDWTRFVDVEIAGYSDRLEIISPGALPNAMTVEKMVAGQRSARNLIIVEVLRDYGYVDARGMGVRTKVIPALKAGGVEPVFQAADDYVKTLLRKTEKHLNKENASLEQKKAVLGAQKVQKAGEYASLTSFQVQLVAGIDENPSISYDALAEKLNKNRTTVMRNIQKLKEMGVLKRIGSKKAGHWEVIG
jgi:ATP-dependent DNA helicase RecG